MGFVVIAASAAAVSLGMTLWGRGNARTVAKRRLRRAVQGLAVLRNPALREVRFLGVGNVGCVFTAQLAPGWQQALGIAWSAADWSLWGSFEPPAGGEAALPRVAIKLAAFKGEAPQRLGVLAGFARESEAKFADDGLIGLCPFLALGLARDARNAMDYVVEVMPLISGESLAAVLPRGLPDSAAALRELKRMLTTALYLERRGYYSRNLDAENVIVQPDGSWMRIDYDTIMREDLAPAKRIRRMARLAEAVLRALPAVEPAHAGTLEQLRAAQRCEIGPETTATSVTTEELIGWVDTLTQRPGRGA